MPVGYAVKSVDTDFKLPAAGKNVSIEANGKTTPVTTDVQHFSLKGDGKSNSLAFELVGDNTPVQLTNISGTRSSTLPLPLLHANPCHVPHPCHRSHR